MALYLTSLILSHFRSHKHARIEVDERPIAIFGPNGAGKTNILEALSLFSPGRGLRRSSAEEMTRRPEAVGWKVSGLLMSLGQAYEIASVSHAGAARLLSIDDKSAPQTRLASLARVLWLIPAMDRLWIEGAEGRRRFLDRMTLSFVPDHAQHALDYERAMRERNRLLKDQVRDPIWYQALEAQMARSGAAMHQNRCHALARLKAAQEGAETAFPAADLSLTHPEAEAPVQEAELAAALSDGRMRDMAAGRALAGPHRTDLTGTYIAKDVPAKDCSTGEQKALLISLILANARALRQDFGAPPILLLDEVAAHLDPDRRAALYDEISALGAQAWMTGTDLALFDTLGTRAQYLEVTESDGVSSVSLNPSQT